MTARWSAVILAATIGTFGCEGGQSGGELGLDGSGGNGGAGSNVETGSQCDETPTALELDEMSPLGFTANDLLAFTEGSHEALMEYLPDQGWGAQVELSPDSESTTLTLTIESQGTAAFVDSEIPASTGGNATIDLAPSCHDYVEVDVTVTIATADGAFDETLDGKLVAYDDTTATLSVPLDLEALDGSFEVTVVDPEGGETVQTWLTAVLGSGVFVGDISGTIQVIGPEVAMATGATYGRWGYGDCEAGRVPVADGPDGVVSPAALLDVVNGASPLDLTWSDATATELSVTASSPGDICLELPDPAFGVEGGRYFLTAEAAFATADERLGTTQPVVLEASADGGSLDSVALSFANAAPVTPADFESMYGLSGVELGDYTDISLLLDVDYAVDGNASTATGELRVVGIPPSDCVDTPNSSCGSPGQQPIETAAISSQ